MRKRETMWKKLLAIILAVTLAVPSVYIPAKAEEETETVETVTEEGSEDIVEAGTDVSSDETVTSENSVEETSSGSEDYTILSEVTTKREEYYKTFLLSDGSYMVARYDTPVHYQDTDGNWQEIDTTLEEATDAEDADGVYETGEHDGKEETISFSKKLKEGKTVKIKGDYPLSFGLSDAENQKAVVVSDEGAEKLTGNNKFLARQNLTQKVLYSDVYEQVDAEYILSSGEIKENLILKEAGARNEFEYLYNIGKLTAVQVDGQTIHLMDGEKVIYQIQAPYMEDAAGAVSHEVTLSITKVKNKKLYVKVTADEEWLQAEERQYPVVIDPVTGTETDQNHITTVFINSLNSYNHYTERNLVVGNESSQYGACRGLVKFDLDLGLGKGDMIVGAQLCMFNHDRQFYSSGTPDLQINAYQVTSSWGTGVVWSTRPSYDSTVLDYNYVRQSEDGKVIDKYWDITEAVKSWYEEDSTNYGILLKAEEEIIDDGATYVSCGAYGNFWSERYNDVTDAYPRILVTYRNNKGLEDYWSYTTVSAGTAGTAYINDYTGNLVFIHNDVSTSGEVMPVSIKHVYNSYMMNKRFAGSHPSAGRGWKLSIQQTVLGSEEYGLTGNYLENFPYAYEDGDGTVHFFYKKEEDGTTKYLDEDGLGLELKIVGSTKTITDKEKNVMTFGAKGNLMTIADARGNKIKVSYQEAEDGKNQIVKVTDGAGHVITLAEYNTTLYNLKTITDPSGRATTYSYAVYNTSSGNKSMVKAEYPDGTSSSYEYDEDGALIKAISSDGSYLKFVYTTLEKGKRVKKVVEYGTDGSIGQTITFDRSKMNTTVIRTSGTDDVFNTDDDLLTTCRFDNYGRTIVSNTKTADGSVYYGGASQSYTAGEVNDSGSNIGKLNRVSESSYNVKAVRNLLKNHSAETDSNWSPTYWLSSSSDYTATMSSAEQYFGNRSLSITGNTVSVNGGGAYSQAVSTDLAVKGKTYTFSGYIKTSNVAKANSVDAGYGACLAVRFSDDSGNYTRKYSNYITGTTATGYGEGWRKVSLTFTVPDDATEVRLYTLLRNATGTAYFDGLQLELGSAANPYNMLDNTSFENASGGTTSGWTMVNTDSDDGSATAHYHNGSSSLKLKGEASVNKYAYQEVPVTGSEDDIYIVSGWAWAEALPDSEEFTRSFDIFARVYYSDGTSTFKDKQAEFNRDVTGWQRASMAFDLDDGNDSKSRTPTKIRVGVRYYKQENAAYFDSMQLVKDTADSYTYDSEGNLITAKENGEQNSSLSYDDENNLTSVKDAENNLYEYTYNDYKQVTTATAPGGQTVNYAYKDNGAHYRTTISNADGDWKLRTGSVLNEETDEISANAYVLEDWDQNGYITRYDVDLESGLVNSVTTPDNTTTSYTYNSKNDLLTKVTSGDASVSYSYDESNTKLMKITHNGFDYDFTYSIYGNPKKTSVAGSVLVTNTYTAKNGKLKQTAYGNGAVKTYTYNTAGNLASEAMNGTTTGSWTYDSSQLPVVYRDQTSKQRHAYSYDVTGRLLETKVTDTTITDTAKDALLFTALYNYDSLNRLERTRIYGDSQSPYVIYSYNENGQNLKADFSTGKELEYSYDSLGRLLGKTITTDTPIQYNYRYHLSARNSGEETTYKTTQLKNELFGEEGYQYEYDKMGNIVKISKGTRVEGTVNSLENLVEKISYEYDSLGQLIRENNLYTSKTIVYTYDNGGNITSKKIYAYNTGDLEEASCTEILYTYDGTWKDKLKSYNGTPITYDGIGNPTTYLGKELTWTGRTLDSLTQNGTKISYTYNADGLRTKKAIGTEETRYYYSNGLLSYEKRSDCELYYTYDADGQLAVINYVKDGTNNSYYPKINSRGDIEGLYNYQGKLKVTYTYDSWGKLVETSDTTTTGIGTINPFRYRGYYYDVETGFYYVSSRYYDPEIGRFISADSAISGVGGDIRGYNMYSYCFNNPVNMSDPTGDWPKWVETAAKVVSVVAVVAAVAVTVTAVTAFTAGTGSAAAVYGASILLGATLSGINGAVANSKKGNSYANGYVGGFTGGSIQAACSKSPGGVILGGGAGVTIGTAVTDTLNNIDPDSKNSSRKQMIKNATTSGLKALATSSVTAYAGYAADLAKVDGAGGLMPSFTYGFAEGFKAFFGWADDAVIYVWE